MTNRTLTDNKGAMWRRVSKRHARFAYENGNEIILAPVNVDPFGPWALGVHVHKDFWSCADSEFDAIVDRFIIFNCNSAELGHYPAYYIRMEV